MTPDEAKATIDRFATADSSMAAIAAVAKQLIDQVAAAAVTLAERERKRAQRARKAVPDKCPGHVPDTVSARARSSSTLEVKIDDDDDPRARNENKISIEQLAENVEQITRENGKLPIGGWNRAVLIAYLQKHVCAGVSPRLIIGAFRVVSARAPIGAPINSLTYFDKRISDDHAAAMAQLKTPLVVSVGKGPTHGNHLQRRIAEAKARQKSQTIGDGGAAGDATAGHAMDATETG
jgi:hypothetical protein